MANNLKSYDQIVPYLTQKAVLMIQGLVDAGMDRDLAMTLVESNLPEEEVYELGDA